MKKYLLILTVLVLLGCSDKDIVGPNIEDFGNPPVITSSFTASVDTLDFASGQTMFFSASFKDGVLWKITITGAISTAEKVITGSGKVIDATNALWNGSVDNPPIFLAENVTAVLSFPNYPLVPSEIVNFYMKKPSGTSTGVIITDFNVSKVGAAWPSDWPVTTNANNDYPYPDGNNYMYMEGTPWQTNNPYVDYMTISAAAADVNYGSFFPLYVNPNQVYFNIMVYNTGTPDTWFVASVAEEDGSSREITIRPDWVGWKLISVKYSNMTQPIGQLATSPNPSKAQSISFVLLSDENVANNPKQSVSVAFDHPIFTHDFPYQQ